MTELASLNDRTGLSKFIFLPSRFYKSYKEVSGKQFFKFFLKVAALPENVVKCGTLRKDDKIIVWRSVRVPNIRQL